jgi:hypothetical protein
MVQIHSPRPLLLGPAISSTRKSKERLVRNQAFLFHIRQTRALLFGSSRRFPNQNSAGGLKVRQAELGGVMAW